MYSFILAATTFTTTCWQTTESRRMLLYTGTTALNQFVARHKMKWRMQKTLCCLAALISHILYVGSFCLSSVAGTQTDRQRRQVTVPYQATAVLCCVSLVRVSSALVYRDDEVDSHQSPWIVTQKPTDSYTDTPTHHTSHSAILGHKRTHSKPHSRTFKECIYHVKE